MGQGSAVMCIGRRSGTGFGRDVHRWAVVGLGLAVMCIGGWCRGRDWVWP